MRRKENIKEEAKKMGKPRRGKVGIKRKVHKNTEVETQKVTNPSSIKNKVKNKYTEMEKELMQKGTKKDKVTTLCLIIERNPNNCYEELNSLLELCQNERNEFVYFVLKNIKDLLLSKLVLDETFLPLKRKLVNTLEFYCSNMFIKKKVIGLIYDIVAGNVLFRELIFILINKLGDKKEISTMVGKYIGNLHKLGVNNELLLFGLEDFYQRDTKSRRNVMHLMNYINRTTDKPNNLKVICYNDLFNDTTKNRDEFEKTLENIITGFLDHPASIEEDDIDESLVLKVFNNANLNYLVLLFLFKRDSTHFHSHLLKIIRSLKMRDFKNLQSYLNLIISYLANEDNTGIKVRILESLLSSAFLYSEKYLLSVLLIASKVIGEDNDSFNDLYALMPYKGNSNKLVAFISGTILENNKIEFFDPFNESDLKRMALIADEQVQ